MYKVRIKSLPKAAYGQQVNGGLNVEPSYMGGGDFNESSLSKNPGRTKSTLTAVPIDEANLEAEGGETAFGPISGQNIPDHMVIKGKRHYEGGVPLNLPDDTFIFSDTKAMKISDPKILAMFGKKSKKGGYTPAELAKPYDIGKYKSILMDPESSQEERNTSIMMIKNFIIKLGALAIAQESKKGFPQGIPAMAKPYMEANGLTEEDLLPKEEDVAQEEAPMQQDMPMQQGQNIPNQMPDGQPIAQPMSEEEMMMMMQQQDPRQMQQAPMAAYGMQMGGYDMPDYMAYGGIPRFEGDKGASTVKNREMTKEELEERSKKATNIRKEKGTGCSPGYVLINGRCVKGSITSEEEEAKRKKRTTPYDPSKNEAFKKSMCSALQSGEYKGKTAQWLADSNIISQSAVAGLQGCENKEEIAKKTSKEDFDIYELENEEQVEVQDCTCTDPVTGQTTTRELQPGEECLCPDGTQGQMGQMALPDNPIWSDVATRGVLTQATMNPNVERVALQRMPYQETRPAFDDYLAKSQQIGSDLSNVGKNIATFSGNTGDAMSYLLQGQAQANQANLANVSGVQTGNINYLNAAEQNDLRARMAADQANVNIGAQEQIYNVGAADKENTNRNQIRGNTQYAVQPAEKEMQDRSLSNFMYPEFATTYNRGLPVFRGQGRTPVPEKPAVTPAQEYHDLLAAGVPQEAAQAIVTKHAKFGYVMGQNVFPFIL